MKNLNVNDDFLQILRVIKTENKSIDEWRAIESSDMFQSEKFCGGFDSIEGNFQFSYYDNYSKEYWFEFTLEEVDEYLNKNIKQIKLRNTM